MEGLFQDRFAKQSVLAAVIAAIFLGGCKRYSLPATYYEAPHSLHTIPEGAYDAIFTCYASLGDEVYINGKDTADKWYLVQTSFYLGTDRVKAIPTTVKVRVNGEPITNGINERVHLKFPTPVTWQVEGDDHYPSITHTIASGLPIDFLSPAPTDTVSMSKSFDVQYNAPGVDSVQFHLSYFADVVERRDTSRTIKRGGQSSYIVVANAGYYMIPPMLLDMTYIDRSPRSDLWCRSHGRMETPFTREIYGFITKMQSHSVV